ncbi:MAG TPA: hypothetical protein VH594_01810 [Trebonia sp.]|jgi:hypothetical protein
MSDVSATDVLDEGLSRLAATGPEYRGGLSNHGPMAAEALVRLGRADAVEPWLDGYLKRLDGPPRPADRITDATWRDALGQLNRVADWEVYLHAELAEEPWRDVLARWWPRLLPGVAAAATHGVIRTSHAARSLAAAGEAGDAERRDELARGLAYWAASYLELSGASPASGHLDLPAALDGLPAAGTASERGLITEELKTKLPAMTGFGDAVAALRPPADPVADLRELAATFTRVFLGYGRTRPIALLHAVTAPVAARSVLPLLPAGLARPTYDALWQVGAALYAVYTPGVTPEPLPAGPGSSRDDVTEMAVAAGDEHAIKLTEACLRLHAETPNPVFLHAAARASDLLAR